MTELHTSESGPRWRPYPAYKDSGVPWLRKIPAHWEVKRIKHTSYIKGRIGWKGLRSEEFIDEGPYLITGTDLVNGQVVWESCYHVNEERYNEDPYIIVRENDLLITKDGTIGKTAIVRNFTGKATLNSGIFLVRPKNKNYIVDYLYWLLNSHVFTAFIDYSKVGSTISHLYQNIFVELKFPIPTGAEQQAVSQFLLKETAKIDALVAKKERQIELLQEKRTALISRAVTRGLDPNVPLKDSGIDWLGHIPAHWEVKRLKNGFEVRLGKMLQPEPATEKDTLEPYLRAANVLWEGVDITDIKEMWFSPDEKNLYEIKAGDLIVCEGGDVGRSALWDGSIYPCYIQNAVHRVRAKIYHSNKFLYYWMFILKSKSYIDLICSKATIAHLTAIKLNELPLLNPPIEEQYKIIDYLDQETAKIDALITKIRESIERLKEYCTALISAAVTGKIDVRVADVSRKDAKNATQ